MASNPFWLRGARGKIAGTVVQKGADGKTIVRDYVIPKNPQTGGQMAQRIIFGTATQAAKFMQDIVNHSFEGVEYGTKSKRAFVQKNIQLMRQAAAQDFANRPTAENATVFVTTKGVSALIPNKYVISDGSLSAPRMTVIRKALGAGVTNTNALQLHFGGGDYVCQVADAENNYLGITVGQLVSALFGLSAADEQLTLCAIAKTGDEYRYSFQGNDNSGEQIAYTGFSAKRLVFSQQANLSQVIALVDGSDGTLLEHASDNLEAAIISVFNDVKTDSELKEYVANNILRGANLTVSETDDGGYSIGWGGFDSDNLAKLYIYDPENDSSFLMAAGVIRSKLVSGQWRRSRTIMQCTWPVGGGAFNFGLVWSIANAAWFEKYTLTDEVRFLNEGGEQNAVGENF